jgi:hypothetical protein
MIIKEGDDTPIDSEDIFAEVDRQRASGELAKAIRKAHGDNPVYGLDRERYGDQVMVYYPDGRVIPQK